jgi:hypothetical protein
MAEQSVWICPKCKRTFRGHVFGEGTSMSGPTCNACCVSLVPPSAQEAEEEVLVMGKAARSAEAGYWEY